MYNWSVCREYEALEGKHSPKWDICITLLLRLRDHCGGRGQRDCESQRQGMTRKQRFLYTTGQMHLWTHSSLDSVHKTCTSSSQIKSQNTRGWIQNPTSWGAISILLLLGGRFDFAHVIIILFKVCPPLPSSTLAWWESWMLVLFTAREKNIDIGSVEMSWNSTSDSY